MSDIKYDEVVNFLPNASRNLKTNDDKFLFVCDPKMIDEKFLFFFDAKIMEEKKFICGLSLQTGVLIFAIISIIQAISSFFSIFSPGSFFMFFVNIVVFFIYLVIGFYGVLCIIKKDYDYARVCYLIASALFILNAIKYICKSVLKIIKFITPWEGDFLKLDFLIYIFGYGIFYLVILYFIYIIYHYMLELKGGEIKNDEKEEQEISNPIKDE